MGFKILYADEALSEKFCYGNCVNVNYYLFIFYFLNIKTSFVLCNVDVLDIMACDVDL